MNDRIFAIFPKKYFARFGSSWTLCDSFWLESNKNVWKHILVRFEPYNFTKCSGLFHPCFIYQSKICSMTYLYSVWICNNRIGRNHLLKQMMPLTLSYERSFAIQNIHISHTFDAIKNMQFCNDYKDHCIIPSHLVNVMG